MKKVICAFLAVLLCISLCACEEETEYTTIRIKNVSVDIPEYWEEEGSESGKFSYFAEKNEGLLFDSITVSLEIKFEEETDSDYDVSFSGLKSDNENMIKAIEKSYNDANVLNDEIYESKHGVKGMLYEFSLNQNTSLFEEEAAKGYCFCFASESDRRWYYITMIVVASADDHNYEKDYKEIIASVNCKNIEGADATAGTEPTTIRTQAQITETQVPTIVTTKISMTADASSYVGKNVKNVKAALEEMGFEKITLVESVTNDTSKNNGAVEVVTIGDTSFTKGAYFDKAEDVTIRYWKVEEPASEYEKAYIRDLSNYDLYYMFDVDTKSVVYFGTNDTYIEKGTYTGDFSTGVTISWSHGQWTEKFTHKSGNNATLIDGNGFNWEYAVCDVATAQKILDGIK